MSDLFPETKWPEIPKPKKLSPDQQRKQRAETRIGLGIHPFGLPLREPRGETCGSCGHCLTKAFAKRYFKCGLMKNTHGPATDLRKGWPACEKWRAK